MKPTFTPRTRGFFIEPLEARIAPATIRIGAIGPVDNETDTEYTEGPNHPIGDTTGPNGVPDGIPDARPAEFAQLNFVDIVTAPSSDLIAAAVRGTGGTALTEVGKYFYLKLHAGDVVEQYTQSAGYDPKGLLRVTSGDVIAFFTDFTATGLNVNEYNDGELTGLALGPNAKVVVNASVNGDIVSALDTHGTKSTADDSLDLSGFVSGKQKITNLKVLGGSAGSILSGGSIQNVTVTGNVDSVLAGTAVNNHLFDLVKVQSRDSLGTPIFDLQGNPVFNAERFEPAFSASAKQAGSGISHLILNSVGDQVAAGDGGLGGAGGALSNITIAQDADGFALHSGSGGGLGAGVTKGGAGGNVNKITVFGTPDGTPDSHFLLTDKNGNPILDGSGNPTFREGIVITSGDGGGATGAVSGGRAGKISAVNVGFNASGVPSFDVVSDSVHILGGHGGDGNLAGAGASIIGVKIRIATPNGIGNEVDVVGGNGGVSNSATGHDGAGGAVSTLDISNSSPDLHALTLVKAGNAGDDAGGLVAKGAAGGGVKNIALLGLDSTLIAGSGSNGSVGGAGGAVSNVTIRSSDIVTPHNLVIASGHGGAGGKAKGGAGGNVSTVTMGVSDLETFSINADGIAGTGGKSDSAKGGRGGSLSHIDVADQDRELGQSTALNGHVDLRAGGGGSGGAGGGAGGALSNVRVTGDHMQLSAVSGAGGNALTNGAGGAGGNINSTFLEGSGALTALDANGLPVLVNPTAQLIAGAGGTGVGASKAGGAGGTVRTASLRNEGDAVIQAGAGGSGQNSGGGVKGGASGKGGSVVSSGLVSALGSGSLIAGNAGVGGSKPGAGGDVMGATSGGTSDDIDGVRAFQNVTIISGDGAHGGRGGDISSLAFEGNTHFDPLLGVVFDAPAGIVTVHTGNGSADGNLAGRGGNITRLTGSVSAGDGVVTRLSAGEGGGSATSLKGAAGGSVSNLTITGGGGTNAALVIEAGNAGDSKAKVGAKGGSVTNVGVTGLVAGTIVRSIASGDGGDATSKGGAAGSIDQIFVENANIGVITGQAFGYDTQGGLFAGLGGKGAVRGANGNVTNVTANSISSIVAGARPVAGDPNSIVPHLAERVANIAVGGTTDNLLLGHKVFSPDGSFRFTFNGETTPQLPADATPMQVQNALNSLHTIQAVGGVVVGTALSSGYTIDFKRSGNQNQISAIEVVTRDVSESIASGAGTIDVSTPVQGQLTLPVTEVRSGQVAVGVSELIPGSALFFATEQRFGTPTQTEIQIVDLGAIGGQNTGQFQLTFNTGTTGVLPITANAAAIQAALNQLPDIAAEGGVTVSLVPGTVRKFQVNFNSTGFQSLILGQAFVHEVEQLDLTAVKSSPTSSFTLSFNGETTASLSSTATTSQIQTALNALNSVKALGNPGTVQVTQAGPTLFNVNFQVNGSQPSITATAQVQEIQKITIAGAATTDTFVIRSGDQVTAPLKVNATAEQVQTALNALPAVAALGGATVVAAADGFVVTYNTSGDKPSLASALLRKESQSINLNGATGSTSDFLIHGEHTVNVSESTMGSNVFGVVSDNPTGAMNPLQLVPGDVARTATTVAGTTSTAETQTINFALNNGSTIKPLQNGDIFILNYNNPAGDNDNTVAIQYTNANNFATLAANINTALNALPNLTKTPTGGNGVTVTGAANGLITIAFNINGDQNQIQIESHTPVPHPGGYVIPATIVTQGSQANNVAEVQRLNLDTVIGRGGVFTLNFFGEITDVVPSANVTLATAIQTALNNLTTVQGFGNVAVKESSLHVFDVTFGLPSDVPTITAQAGVPESESLDLTNLRTDPNALVTFQFRNAITAPIAASSTATQIQTALNALASITTEGGVRVFDGATAGTFRVDFNKTGPANGDLPNIIASGGGAATHEHQRLDLGSMAAYTDGLVSLTFGTQPAPTVPPTPPLVITTPLLSTQASASDIQDALNALDSVKNLRGDGQGTVTVTKLATGVFDVEFNVSGDQSLISGQGAVYSDRFPVTVTQTQHGAPAVVVVNEQKSGANFTTQVQESVTGSATVQEKQVIDLSALTGLSSSSGDFTLSFGPASTNPLPAGATAAQVQDALNALPTIKSLGAQNSGSVTVAVDADNHYTVTFAQTGNQALIGSQARTLEVQKVDIGSLAGSTGEFDLQFQSQHTGVLTGSATTQQVEDALNALTSIQHAGGVHVTSPSAGVFNVTFQGLGDPEPLAGEGGLSKSTQRLDLGAMTTAPVAAGEPAREFTLTFNGATTDPLPANASAAAVQAALNSLPTIKDTRPDASGAVTVTQDTASTGYYTIQFNSTGDVPTISGESLSVVDRIIPVTTNTNGTTTTLPVTTTTDGTTSVKEIQSFNPSNLGANDQYQLTFDNNLADSIAGYTTATLSKTATAADVAAALNGLKSVSDVGGVSVAADGNGGFNITFNQVGNRESLSATSGLHEQQNVVALALAKFNVPVTTPAQGNATTNESQVIDLAAVTSEFRLDFGSDRTDVLPANATSADIQAALNALSSVKASGPGGTGSVTVTDGPNHTFNVAFATPGDQPSLGGEADFSSGVFHLAFGGDVTKALQVGSSAQDVQDAVNALASIKALRSHDQGTVSVTAKANGDYQIDFNVLGDQGDLVGTGTVAVTPSLDLIRTHDGATASTVPVPIIETTPGRAIGPVTAETVHGADAALEVQLVDVTQQVTNASTYVLSFGDTTDPNNTTAPIAFDAAAADVQTALNNLPAIQQLGGGTGSVTVTDGTAPGTFNVQFNVAGDQDSLIGADATDATIVVPVTETTKGGLPANEIQNVDLHSLLTTTFTVQFGTDAASVQTGANDAATATRIETALNNLPSIQATGPNGAGGAVTVSVTPDGTFDVAFNTAGDKTQVVATEFPTTEQTQGGTGINEVQHVDISKILPFSNATFQLTYNGASTPPLSRFALPDDVQTAVNAIVPGGVFVTSNTNGTYDITFKNDGDQAGLILATAGNQETQHIDTTLFQQAGNSTFQLTFKGATTPVLPETSTAAQVAAALNALPSIQAAGGVKVVGTQDALFRPNGYDVAFNTYVDQAPITGTTAVFEQQVLDLHLLPNGTTGGEQFIQLTFNGATTPLIPASAGAAGIAAALNVLPTIAAAGSVAVVESEPGLYQINFNQSGAQPLIIGKLNPFGTTERISGLATPREIEAGLDKISLSDVNLTAGSVSGSYNATFADNGDQLLLSGVTNTHEQQIVDIFAAGDFTLTINGETTGIIPGAAFPGQSDKIRAALNALDAVKALGGVKDVIAGPNSSFAITFTNDGDKPLLDAQQEITIVAGRTVRDGGPGITEAQEVNYATPGSFSIPAFNASRLVGAIVDVNEIGSNQFHFLQRTVDPNTSAVTYVPVVADATHVFHEGDIPIDGIVMAKILDQSPGSINFLPEARLTSDGFFDNLNRI